MSLRRRTKIKTLILQRDYLLSSHSTRPEQRREKKNPLFFSHSNRGVEGNLLHEYTAMKFVISWLFCPRFFVLVAVWSLYWPSSSDLASFLDLLLIDMVLILGSCVDAIWVFLVPYLAILEAAFAPIANYTHFSSSLVVSDSSQLNCLSENA